MPGGWRAGWRHNGGIGRQLVAYIIALLLLVPVMPVPAVAAPDAPISMQVVAGFDGVSRTGYWQPVSIELQNDGPDLNAEIRIEVIPSGFSGGSLAYTGLYRQPVNLPRGAHKRITMYIPPISQQSIEVRLNAGEKQVLAQKVALHPVNSGDLLVGILHENATAVPGMQNNLLPSISLGRQVVQLRLDKDQLPSYKPVLDPFNLLIISDFPSQELSGDQRAALEAWVSGGGTLVVAGGPQWRKALAGLPATLLPVQPESLIDLPNLAGLQQLVDTESPAGQVQVTGGSLRPESIVLARSGDTPLIATHRFGDGHVIYMAADPFSAPLANWNGMNALWRELLMRVLPDNVLTPSQYGVSSPGAIAVQNNISGALANLPVLDLPSSTLLAGVLLVYILLAGPVNYLILRRLRRRRLAWLTVPLLSLAFVALTYGMAFSSKGNDVVTNTISLVRSVPGMAVQPVTTYMGIFAPSETTYELQLASDGLVAPLPVFGGAKPISAVMNNPEPPVGIEIEQRNPSTVRLLGVEQWTMRSIYSEGTLSQTVNIATDLHISGDHLVGTITNRSSLVLTGCVVIAGDNFQSLDLLRPGESLPVDLQITTPLAAYSKGSLPVLYRVYNSQPGAGPPTPEQRAAQLKQQIATTILGEDGYSAGVEIPLIFLGWADTGMQRVTVNGQSSRGPATMLVYATIDPAPQGEFSIPSGILKAHLIDLQSSGISWNPGSFQMSVGSITLQVGLPERLRMNPTAGHLDSLLLNIPVPGSTSTLSDPLKVEFYDWSKHDWVTVPAALNLAMPPGGASPTPVAIPGKGVLLPSAISMRVINAEVKGESNAARYLSPDGMVRVRLTKNTRDSLTFGKITLGIHGNMGKGE